jgi:hypothetical protein
VAVAGNQITGFTAISYKDKTEKELLYGSGRKPIGVGIGNESYEASISMYRYEIDRILAGITGEKKLSRLATFPITVVAQMEGESTFQTDVILAQFMESGRDMSQGDKMDIVELPLLVVDIQYNV